MQHRLDIPDAHYRLLFEAAPEPYLILRPDAQFTILAVNSAYAAATLLEREAVIGRGIFEVFPDNPEDPAATGVANLRASLQRVVANRAADAMAVQRYDIPRPASEGGGFIERYWSPVNVPVLAEDGELRYIIHRVEDVTAFVQLSQAREREHRQTASLQAENEQMAAELVNRSEQLYRANAELRLAARRRDEFLAILAHELRNPLAAVRNGVQLLQRQGNGHDQRLLQLLARGTETLRTLVDELLDMSRVDRGLVELHRQPVDLRQSVHHALETVQALMDEKEHTVDLQLPEDPVVVEGDPVRLEQVLVNVLSNAGKYTDPGGEVSLLLRRRGSEAELRVRDTGSGIDPEVLGRIFELFGQGERDLARAAGGLGIGLHIARRLVELHGGEIEAYSAGAGRGADFLVRLPVAAADAPTAPEARTAADTSPGGRILLADDNQDAAQTLAVLLEELGHEVTVVHDGPEALRAALRLTPPLILLDIGLPGLDGYELARRLRDDPRTRGARLAAITGYGQPKDVERSRAAGFDRHFTKPVDIQQLMDWLAATA